MDNKNSHHIDPSSNSAPDHPSTPMNFFDTPATINPSSDAAQTKKSKPLKWLAMAVGGLAVLVVAAALAGYYVYDQAVNHPEQATGQPVEISIAPGSTNQQIAQQLTEANLLQNQLAFNLYLRLNSQKAQIQAGDFAIPQHISIKDLVSRLGVAVRQQAIITFREGLRREEMAEIIEQHYQDGQIIFTGQQFSDLALSPSPAIRHKLGSRLPATASLQGYLFPDTYHIDRDATAEDLINKMLDNYLKKVPSTLQAGFAQQNLSEHQALILAAIVERESFAGDERPLIAQIMLNRLETGQMLGADATVQYAIGYSQEEKRWWKQGLTMIDLDTNSPYNTRKFAGLPPAPIANPGQEAIAAVAQPQPTDYFYYLHDPQGNIHFARTLAEHEANIARYLR